MLYSANPTDFQKVLLNNIIPQDGIDYPFFATDLLNALSNQGNVSIIPYKPFASAIGDKVIDADYNNVNGIETITLKFNQHADFDFYVNRKEIKQPSGRKFYVNDPSHEQEINITFI